MTTFDDGIRVKGTIRADSIPLPANSVGSTQFSAADPLAVSKQVHQYVQTYQQDHGAVVATKTSGIHIAQGDGTVEEFKAALKTANIGAATVTVDLKKNGTTVLSATADLDSGDAAYAVVSGTISTAAYSAGDVFEVLVTATAGGGTLGQGLTVILVVNEDQA